MCMCALKHLITEIFPYIFYCVSKLKSCIGGLPIFSVYIILLYDRLSHQFSKVKDLIANSQRFVSNFLKIVIVIYCLLKSF